MKLFPKNSQSKKSSTTDDSGKTFKSAEHVESDSTTSEDETTPQNKKAARIQIANKKTKPSIQRTTSSSSSEQSSLSPIISRLKDNIPVEKPAQQAQPEQQEPSTSAEKPASDTTKSVLEDILEPNSPKKSSADTPNVTGK